MKLQGSIDLFHYWNRLRSGRPAPLRAEIDPAAIKALLSDTFILEQDSRAAPIFRLAGTRLCAVFGRELKGYSFLSMWTERDRKLKARLCLSAFDDKVPVICTFQGHTATGRTNGFELLLLPLVSGTESNRCLGIISATERPFWLGAEPIVECCIDAIRLMDPDGDLSPIRTRAEVAVPSLEPSEHFLIDTDGQSRSARRIRHLLVINGGKSG